MNRKKEIENLILLADKVEKLINEAAWIQDRINNDKSPFASTFLHGRELQLELSKREAVNAEVEFKLALRKFAIAEGAIPELQKKGVMA